MEGREEEARIVADTNILVSALIRDHSVNAKIIKSGYFAVYFPDYGLKEIDRYQDYIKAKREKRSEHLSFEYAREFIFKSVQVVPLDHYRDKMISAFKIMKEIDEKDAPILALAMQLGCPVWSNDRHFQRQTTVNVYTTEDIVKLLGNSSEIPSVSSDSNPRRSP
jgi:predicted nucleic acid-binding protein